MACGQGEPPRDRPEDLAAVDSLDPGTVLRWGPMPESEPIAPIVRGDSGQITIYEGYFLMGGCDQGLGADATAAGDTIVFTLLARPDTAPAGACEAETAVMGYAALVGPVPAGDRVIRVVHEGEMRDEPIDSAYTVTVAPPRRR